MKRNYKHILFPFVLCGLMAAQTSAAPGIVKGRITDTQGKPVAQVVVTDGRNFTTTDGITAWKAMQNANRWFTSQPHLPTSYRQPTELLTGSTNSKKRIRKKTPVISRLNHGKPLPAGLCTLPFPTLK